MSDHSRKLPALKDVLSANLRVTGNDIPVGTYGGILFGFSDPFMIKVSEQFRKEDGPTERAVFEARFGVYVKGKAEEVDYLIPVPDGGAANRRSNLYKMLRALGAGNNKLLTDEGFAESVNMQSFIGCVGVVAVKKNAKDFPQVESVGPKMDGVKYPTLEECKGLDAPASSESIPF
jgi:hypothetical protein